jgi:catalase
MTLKDKDFSTSDLYGAIKKGDFPSWTMYAQIMPEKEAEGYRFDVFDITKIWPHSDYPL